MLNITEKQISALHHFYLCNIAAKKSASPAPRLVAELFAAGDYAAELGLPGWLINTTAAAGEKMARFPLARPNIIRAGINGLALAGLSNDEKTIIKLARTLARA